MKNVFLPTQNYQRAQALVDELLGPALGVEMAAIIGPAGRGKTFAIERIYSNNKNTVYVLYQECWSHIELMREIVFRLSGARPRLRQACFDILQDENRERRRLIMVDDADRMNSKCLNLLRNLHDILKMPILLVGEPGLDKKIEREKRLLSRAQYLRNSIFFKPAMNADISLFFKQALNQPLTQDQIIKLHKHSDGDFRNILSMAIATERFMSVNNITAITDRVIDEICNNGKK